MVICGPQTLVWLTNHDHDDASDGQRPLSPHAVFRRMLTGSNFIQLWMMTMGKENKYIFDSIPQTWNDYDYIVRSLVNLIH